jgi:hypothetical protein
MAATSTDGQVRSGPLTVRKYTHFTEAVQSRFFSLLAQGWTVSKAARSVGTSKERVYQLRRSNLAFRDAFQRAYEEGTQRLEDEARRRAVDGIIKRTPHFYKGGKIGETISREYSDELLMFLLKARRPEVYGDGAGHGRFSLADPLIETQRMDLSRLSSAELATLWALQRKALGED